MTNDFDLNVGTMAPPRWRISSCSGRHHGNTDDGDDDTGDNDTDDDADHDHDDTDVIMMTKPYDYDDDTDYDGYHKNDSCTAAGAAPGASFPCSLFIYRFR